MKKKLLFLCLFFYSNVFAQSYCIYVDEFYLNEKNEKQIEKVLEDIAYPSFKIKNNKVYIYSGKFTKYDNAKNILKLLNTKYKNAKVASCKEAQEYRRGMQLLQSKISHKRDNERVFFKPYCLKILDIPLSEKNKEKNKINYILTHFPDTKTKTDNQRFLIYSGKFASLKSAQTVADALKEEFPQTMALRCSTDLNEDKFYRKVPSKSSINKMNETDVVNSDSENLRIIYPKRKVQKKEAVKTSMSKHNNSYLISQERKYEKQKISYKEDEVVTIFHLDHMGYISQDIKSYKSRTVASNEDLLENSIATYNNKAGNNYFNGLYLKFNTAYDTRNSDVAYDTRLEYDLFKEGYFEQKKRKTKQTVAGKLKVFQMIKTIYSLHQDKEFSKIDKYRNSVVVSNLLLNLRFVENFLNDARKKVELGYITKYEYRKYQLVLRKIQNTLYVYNQKILLKIPANVWFLLNNIEKAEFVDSDKLLAMLMRNSLDIKETNILQQKSSSFTNEWADRLKVNFYVGERKLYASQKQTLFGVDAKIPLYDNSVEKNRLQKIENSLRSQKAHYTFSKEKDLLEELLQNIKDGQNKIHFSQEEMMDIKRYVDELNVILESGFSSYTKINYKTKQKAIRQYLNLYFNVQKERINIYKNIVKLLYLVHSRSLEEILYIRD
ncbi:hypothetical protein LCX93_07800 [Sulfurimonas sp. SWIR-19]|uniref:hypothetical protein n=1 Tax=Sulfurimonas sp. SWIR-19 TaxID=2878390 RepID=UPI001CF4DA43|nr:hypothetical protein [Sulfurimonas sp. SWIR-19]UCM99439.1 hypothetical protein LCX93_07800 [Sulfurimonas sp. SWIR-19]